MRLIWPVAVPIYLICIVVFLNGLPSLIRLLQANLTVSHVVGSSGVLLAIVLAYAAVKRAGA